MHNASFSVHHYMLLVGSLVPSAACEGRPGYEATWYVGTVFLSGCVEMKLLVSVKLTVLEQLAKAVHVASPT